MALNTALTPHRATTASFQLAKHTRCTEPVGGHLLADRVFLGDITTFQPRLGGLHKKRTRQEKTSRQPVCFLLLVRITGVEDSIPDFFDRLHLMLKQYVSKLMGDITMAPT